MGTIGLKRLNLVEFVRNRYDWLKFAITHKNTIEKEGFGEV